MARSTMATLIARVRVLVSDPAGANQAFTDDNYQDWLDQHRELVNYAELEPVVSIAAGGATTYLAHEAGVGWWEEDEQLVSSTYAALTPSTADRLTGRWTFTSHTPSAYLVGRTFDLNAAAADALLAWATKVKLGYDFGTDGQMFHRSQRIKAMEDLAAGYRRKARIGSTPLVRGDSAPSRAYEARA